MAAKCRLIWEVVRSSRLGGRLTRPRWDDVVTRGCDRGARTLSACPVVLQPEGSVWSARYPSSSKVLRWQGGRKTNTFHGLNFGTHKVPSKKWLRNPGVSVVHTVDAKCDTEIADIVDLLQSRDCSRGTLRASEAEWEQKSLSSGTAASSSSTTWWSFGDCIHEVLHLPNEFEQQVEMLAEKLGCRLTSQELLLRVVVHRSYYEANMPVAVRDQKKVIPSEDHLVPSSDLGSATGGASEILFSECHRQARASLALLGDSVLGVVTTQALLREHPFQPTVGEITQRKSQLLCNSNLSRVWSFLGLDNLPLKHPSESMSKAKVHADTIEALIGAVATEKGSKFAEDFVAATILPLLKAGSKARNPISLLQEQSLTALQIIPEYRVIGIDNKDTPLQVFRVRVYVKGVRMATGLGSSSKTARQDAADKAIRKWPERVEQLSRL